MKEHRGRLTKDGIRIYETSDFAGMHAAGAVAAGILDDIAAHVFPGQTTGEIDRIITDSGISQEYLNTLEDMSIEVILV